MARSIIEFFEQVPDSRRRAGQRHNQTFVLVLVLMSTMSGYVGYRAIGDFMKRNKAKLLYHLQPRKNRLPSFDTVRRVVQSVDFSSLSKAFSAWALHYVDITDKEWVSVDGKAISGTAVVQSETHKQEFVALVSAYCSRQNMVIGNAEVNNGKESEIPVVQTLLEALHLRGVTFTLDALHCQKKQLP